ncbi:MAG: response regulator [Archangium sp.]
MARILVVEDEALVARLIPKQLAGLHDVTVVHDAAMALEMLHMEQFDLVLSDINMPGKSGVELHDELTRRGTPARIIFITGGTNPEVTNFLARVPNKWLTKPYSREQLIAAIDAELASVPASSH